MLRPPEALLPLGFARWHLSDCPRRMRQLRKRMGAIMSRRKSHSVAARDLGMAFHLGIYESHCHQPPDAKAIALRKRELDLAYQQYLAALYPESEKFAAAVGWKVGRKP